MKSISKFTNQFVLRFKEIVGEMLKGLAVRWVRVDRCGAGTNGRAFGGSSGKVSDVIAGNDFKHLHGPLNLVGGFKGWCAKADRQTLHLMPDGWAASGIASTAYGLHIKRLGIVAVVVFSGGTCTVRALKMGWVSKFRFLDCLGNSKMGFVLICGGVVVTAAGLTLESRLPTSGKNNALTFAACESLKHLEHSFLGLLRGFEIRPNQKIVVRSKVLTKYLSLRLTLYGCTYDRIEHVTNTCALAHVPFSRSRSMHKNASLLGFEAVQV